MPLLGFGTWQIMGEEAYQVTLAALQVGYRHIDTAQLYQNERQVGRAILDSGLPRQDVFLATKLSDPTCFRRARVTFDAQLHELGTDYVDLYMLHQPCDRESMRVAWKDMETLYAEGKIRALGISNFNLRDVQDLLEFASVPPVYLQNKLNVYAIGEQHVSAGESLVAFTRLHGIQLVGYSVINPWPNILRPAEDPHVISVAARYERTPAQVLLRWALQLGMGVIPKSCSRSRIEENFRIFDFELADVDVRLLTGLVTLAASAGNFFAPSWVEDIYGLAHLDSDESL